MRSRCSHADLAEIFTREHDPTGIPGEDNILRYQPCRHLLVRLGEESRARDAARVLLAAAAAGVAVTVSAHPEAAVGAVVNAITDQVVTTRESDEALGARLAELDVDRVRALGLISHDLREAIHARPTPLVEAPPVDQGRLELLTVFKEQSLTVAYHRYGNLGLREDSDAGKGMELTLR